MSKSKSDKIRVFYSKRSRPAHFMAKKGKPAMKPKIKRSDRRSRGITTRQLALLTGCTLPELESKIITIENKWRESGGLGPVFVRDGDRLFIADDGLRRFILAELRPVMN